MSNLQPHQQRVLDEYNELGERLAKLNAFIGSPKFNEVDATERTLLMAQAHHMTAYFVTLKQRVDFHAARSKP